MDHPSSIQFYPTLRCNQSCSFCFNLGVSNAFSYKDMDVRQAYTLGNMLINSGVREIDILGGEPMLIPWLRNFVTMMIEKRVAVNVSTNGSLPEVASRFLGLSPDLMNIGISLHGFSGIHNALTRTDNFSRVVSGIKRMIREGINPIVKSALLQENKNEIYELVAYLQDLGVRKYYLLHEDVIGRKETSASLPFSEFLEFYLNLAQNFSGALDIHFVAASGFYEYGSGRPGRCDAGIEKIAVMPDGSAFPCNLFAGFREFSLGNVFSDGIEKVWENPMLDYFRNHPGDNKCRFQECKHHFTCTGGCPAHSYYFFGNVDSVDPRCLNRKFE